VSELPEDVRAEVQRILDGEARRLLDERFAAAQPAGDLVGPEEANEWDDGSTPRGGDAGRD